MSDSSNNVISDAIDQTVVATLEYAIQLVSKCQSISDAKATLSRAVVLYSENHSKAKES